MSDGNLTIVVTGLEKQVNELNVKVSVIDKQVAQHEVQISNIKEYMKAIKDNTTWILRLVIGAFVLGALYSVFNLRP